MNACTRTSAVVTLIYLRILAIFPRWSNATLTMLLIWKDIVTVLSKVTLILRALFVGLMTFFIIWPSIMDLGLRSIKSNKWSGDNFKNTSFQSVVHLGLQYSQVTLVSGYPFWELSIDHNMDVLAGLARNARSLLESSQSERAYYCRQKIICIMTTLIVSENKGVFIK